MLLLTAYQEGFVYIEPAVRYTAAGSTLLKRWFFLYKLTFARRKACFYGIRLNGTYQKTFKTLSELVKYLHDCQNKTNKSYSPIVLNGGELTKEQYKIFMNKYHAVREATK